MATKDIFDNGVKTLRELIDSKNKTVGYLVLPSNYDGSDPTKVDHFTSLIDAKFAAGDVTKRQIDKVGGTAIFVETANGFPMKKVYSFTMFDNERVVKPTLTAARTALGFEPAAPTKKPATSKKAA